MRQSHSQPYANAAYNEMVAAVTALGLCGRCDPEKRHHRCGQQPHHGDGRRFHWHQGWRVRHCGVDSRVGGFVQRECSAVRHSNRAACSFFLFPDQCSACANIDQITQPIINAAWLGISTGVLFNNSSLTRPTGHRCAQWIDPHWLLPSSSLDPMTVYDYRALNNVPAYNALYMPPQAASPETRRRVMQPCA